MKNSSSILRKIALFIYLAAIHLLAAIFIYQSFFRPHFNTSEIYAGNIKDPSEKFSVPTPLPIPSIAEPTPAPTGINANQAQDNETANSPSTLMIPVAGVKREQLQDTYTDARSEGRVHNAIDIIAPQGTSVVAAADGEIVKFFDSERGGTTIYQYSEDRRFIYYYAHLQKRAENVAEKMFVRRGTIIGYIGDTGNAGAGNFHLHFAISIANDPQRYWEGTEINPYPLLKNGIESP